MSEKDTKMRSEKPERIDKRNEHNKTNRNFKPIFYWRD